MKFNYLEPRADLRFLLVEDIIASSEEPDDDNDDDDDTPAPGPSITPEGDPTDDTANDPF